MPLYTYEGDLLVDGGALATSSNCCCDPGSACACCSQCLRGIWVTVSGWSNPGGPGDCEDCDNFNATWYCPYLGECYGGISTLTAYGIGADCGFGPNSHSFSVSWSIFCVGDDLHLTVNTTFSAGNSSDFEKVIVGARSGGGSADCSALNGSVPYVGGASAGAPNCTPGTSPVSVTLDFGPCP